MLVQDHLTGQLHEVPDEAAYGYADEGYGFPPLLPILGKIAPIVLPQLMSMFSQGFKGAPGYDGYEGYADEEFDGYADETVPQGQVLYDGLGNPVGFAPLVNIAKAVLPSVARTVARTVAQGPAQMVRTLAPVAQAAMRGLAPVAQAAMRGLMPRPMPIPRPMPMPMPVQYGPRPLLPAPPGWRRPPVPYTGARPSRAYMRCSVWPGGPGLVPTGIPGLTPAPAGPVQAPVRRRRRRR